MAGRTVAVEALRRGHDVTCLARGLPTHRLGPFVAADRDLEDGLAPVAGGEWDAVVDVTRHPGHARRAVRDLTAAHRVLVSTGNVYASFDALEQTEEAPLRDPLEGDVMSDMEVYGEAKVACEEVVAAPWAGRHRPVGAHRRPGRLVGRTGYWPWRFAHPVGAGRRPRRPDSLRHDRRSRPRGVAGHGTEQRLDGTFNATGPTVSLAAVLAASARVAGSTADRSRWHESSSPSSGSATGWGPHRCLCGSTTPTGEASRRWTPRGPGRPGRHAPPRAHPARHARLRGDVKGASPGRADRRRRAPGPGDRAQPVRWRRCSASWSCSDRRGPASRAEQFTDAVQPLGHGVDVHVQGRRGVPRARAREEVGLDRRTRSAPRWVS